MIHVDTLVDLYAHMEWADAQLWKSIATSDVEMPNENLHERLFHLHFTQLAFLGVWRGDEFKMLKADEFEATDLIKEEARKFYPAARNLLANLSDADLTKPMPLPWAKYFARQLGGEVATTTLGDTMMQVAMHTQHHRGQVNTVLRSLGGEPQLVDYIGWVWSGRPAPSW